jgi:hypothetical protein
MKTMKMTRDSIAAERMTIAAADASVRRKWACPHFVQKCIASRRASFSTDAVCIASSSLPSDALCRLLCARSLSAARAVRALSGGAIRIASTSEF